MGTKDNRLNFRVGSGLKEKVERIAAQEGRSVAQVCEAFLQGGLAAYEKEGSKYISRFLGLRESSPKNRDKAHN
jgi:hypothetical protein